MAYMLLYQFFGLNAPIFHAANVIIFTADAFLAYLIVGEIIHNKYAGIISGLLFLVAPIQVESIMWISELKTTLANFFIFSSFLIYIFYRESGKKNQLILSICLWVMGLMSKGTAFTLPIMFILYDFLFYPEKFRKFYKYYIPLIAISTIFVLSYFIFLHDVHSNIPFLHHLQRAIVNTAGLFSYPLHQIVPLNMKLFYLSLPYQSWFSIHIIFSIIFLIIIVYIVWKCYKKLPYISFFLLWYGINITPGSGIGNVPAPLFGTILQGFDHYLVLPYFGIASLLGIGLWELNKRLICINYKIVYLVCFILIFTSLGTITIKRSHGFINNIELSKSLTEEYPKNPSPLASLIGAYLLNDETEKAQFYLHEMNKRFPDNPFTDYYNGVFLTLQNKDKDAEGMFQNAKQEFHQFRINDYLAATNLLFTVYDPPYTSLSIDRIQLLKLKNGQLHPRTFFANILCNATFPAILAPMYTLEQLQRSFIHSFDLEPLGNIMYGCNLLMKENNLSYACAQFNLVLSIFIRNKPYFTIIPSAYIPLLRLIEHNNCRGVSFF